tara:strand:+ start:707 stop:979 length:273 start_codon:yes stop_codon:yes gene_type:complete
MKNAKSITVNKKKYYFYRIEWLDILGDAGHRNYEDLCNMKPACKITYAFLFKKTNKTIHTFNTYDVKEEEFSDCNVFPRGVIVSMNKIQI